MEWLTVDCEGLTVEAININILDGVFVRDPRQPGIAFVPGWRVEQQAGDTDGPTFREREKKLPVYGIELRVQE